MGAMGEPSAVGFAVSLVLWVVLGFGPGYLVATAVEPWRPALDRLAIAPLVSTAMAFASATWLGVLGVPRAVGWFVPVLVGVSFVAGAVVLRRHRSASSRATRATRVPWVRRRTTWLGLAALLGLSLVLWIVAISASTPGWSLVVPNSDGNSHGLMVARILLTGSADSRDVLFYDLAEPQGAGIVYPIGVHLMAAPIAWVTGPAASLVVPLTVLGSMSLVLGTVALTRRVAGTPAALAAGLAAVVLIPWLPYGQVSWGPVPMVMAISLVPAATLAVLDVRAGRGLVVAALALAGLLAVHTTEALVVAALLAVTLVATPGGGRPRLRRAALAAASAAGAVVLVAPYLWGLLASGASRPADLPPRLSVADAVAFSVFSPFFTDVGASGLALVLAAVCSLIVLGLAMVGALRGWPVPLGRALVVVAVVLTVLAAGTHLAAPAAATAPWYSNGDRLMTQVAGLIPGLVGIGVVTAARRFRARGAARVVVAGIAAVVVAVSTINCVATASTAVSAFSVVTPADRDAFAWLSTHVRPGERVLNDHRDGSVWAYEATGGAVAPVFGAKPGGGWEVEPAFTERLYLRDHVADIATDPRARGAARAWAVRYVLVGERTFADSRRLVDADALVGAAGLREVFRSGGARVYEIVAP